MPVTLETDRLILRPRKESEAAVYRQLWTERDVRVPAHRRIDREGRPTVEDIAAVMRAERDGAGPGLLAVHVKERDELIGYCGLIAREGGPADEPELAYELLLAAHGRGYATEAAGAVVAWADAAGYRRLWAGVWDWNVASRGVLRKIGFRETGHVEKESDFGRSLLTVRESRAASGLLPDVSPGREEVVLREFAGDDISMLRELADDPYISATGSLPAHADEGEARAYIERQRLRRAAGRGYPFCIARGSDDSAVGTVGLWLDEEDPAVARAGYSISPPHRGRGYARLALDALTRFAAGLPELRRIDLHIEPWNVASIRVAESAGYRLVGIEPHPRRAEGPSVEMLLYRRTLR